MNENTKTLSFVGVAAALLLGAYLLRQSPVSIESQDDIGQQFFPDFQDPLAATTLEVVEYDDPTGTLRPFKVAQINGVWSIPSHEGYPADAKNQLEQAAVAVMGLEKLQMVSDSPGAHETYGVVDPDAAKLEVGASGVGKRVTLEDKSGNKLAQFIIGKQDPDKPELHYVRVPGQDRVYRALVKTDKLSTKFQNWIEQDLLKLNAFDIKEVVMDDHSVDELNPNQPLIQRGLTVVDYDNKESKWKLVKMEAHDQTTGKWEEIKLTDDQELDTQKLNDLKTALDDLKIVDVRHKPPGLSKDLKVGEELVADRATRQALQQRGFYLAQVQDGFALFSNEGEVRCGLNDGVEYILRFGEIAGQGSGDEENAADKPKEAAGSEDEKAADKTKDANTDKGVDRYIMVTAQFRQDLIPKPELEPLPEGSEEASEQPAAAADAAAAPAIDAPKVDAAPADAPAAVPAAAAEAPKNEAADRARQREAVGELGEETLLAMADEAQPPAAATPAADKPVEGAPVADAKADPPVDPDVAAEAEEKAKVAKAAERKRIEADNKRKEDDYKKKVEDGEKRVKELNERFADWYFVISDSTYKKIHIGRDELVKEKSAQPAAGTGPADFKGLPGLPPQ